MEPIRNGTAMVPGPELRIQGQLCGAALVPTPLAKPNLLVSESARVPEIWDYDQPAALPTRRWHRHVRGPVGAYTVAKFNRRGRRRPSAGV